MATFKRVRIEAEKAKFPVLLSNGNLLEEGDCGDGKHYAVWHGELFATLLLLYTRILRC
jgi:aminopeptidase N